MKRAVKNYLVKNTPRTMTPIDDGPKKRKPYGGIRVTKADAQALSRKPFRFG